MSLLPPRRAGALLSSAFLALLSVATGATNAQSYPDSARVVSVGGSLTEIVYALGAEDRLAGRDATSTWPPKAEELPDVGYMRALSPEGVLSVEPDLILTEEGAGPPETMDILASAGVPLVIIPDTTTADGVLDKIHLVGAALGLSDRADELAARVATELDEARGSVGARDGSPAPRVLFILSTQGGRITAAGTDTAADAIIELAGGQNAVSEFSGYKQMSDEAVTAAAPQVILMMDRGGDHAAANDELFAMPALVTTPVAQTRNVVRMDGLTLLGFGPRTATAIRDLAEALNGAG
ncbi:ABC transporter substrate-binding protein [Paracoccus sp. Z330]|uniref:ABC transporter substrate-binding protein n=1 Tax=Paracoccus onchidii TaxID=3017813 RepID=A0ABT4ZEJ3_9RHOB|nr:ABC transporter substrate-binding protein [Paracoccus onchidii]MDB6177679.1 ABC transporter substrate-binding protein [Paracoccus onchidii]